MCGLAGAYYFKRGNLHTGYFLECLGNMHRRGPDDQQFWQNDQNYIAVFSRLSIRDISLHGRQPMFSACGKFCLSFNGEIYNTDSLRILLQPYDIKYQSASDTEVLLYALIYLGIKETLKSADGIFAFAFYDIVQNRLWLARDRMGVKPLYLGICDDGVVYSSQYNHVINHPFFYRNSYNEKIISLFLYLGYMPEGDGIIQQTSLLPHGHYLEVNERKATMHIYYEYPSEAIIGDNIDLEKIIETSVKEQLVSDVPVGTFMSGGVDSTLVSYFANKNKPIQSFTIGVHDPQYNEADIAQQYAARFQLEHFSKYITENDLKKLVEDHVQAFSEPFADYSSLPTLLLSAFAKEKVTVALSADGGDELFWGYPRNVKALQNIYYYKSGIAGRRIKLLWKKLQQNKTTEFFRHWNNKSFIHFYYSTLSITGAMRWLPIITEIPAALPYFLLPDLQKQASGNLSDDDFMQLIRKIEMDIHLQRILLKVDKASMYHSLEVRVPLLSNQMLDASLHYSHRDCIRDKRGKMNLRNILMAHAGKELVMQPKRGFTVPMDQWLRRELKNEVHEKIMDMPARLSSFFSKDKLSCMLQLHAAGKQHCGWFIWALYTLIRWDDTHHQNGSLH